MRAQRFRGNVFVANLPKDVGNTQLAALFDSFGLVIGALVARDHVTGESKGYGLVDLAPPRAVQPAIQALTGTKLSGRRIEVRVADPGSAITLKPVPSRNYVRAY